MQIEFANKQHHQSLVDLLYEMCLYYDPDSTASKADVRQHLTGNLLAPDSAVRLVVVSDNGIDVRGFAAISMFHSLVDPMSQTATQLFMKELYIRSSCRSCGLGKAVMKWIAGYALSKGCARMDWTVNSSNHAAQDFYHSLGAAYVADRWHYRMTAEGLSNLASRNESRFHD